MKFYALTETGRADDAALEAEYQIAREIGNLRLGRDHLFFRAKLKKYYIPFREITRCYRRVFLVPFRMCCGRSNMSVENLVICRGEKELAQIPLPDTKAAREVIRVLKLRMPGADFSSPAKPEEEQV